MSKPRPKINGRDHTDVTMEMIDRINPNNKRQYAVWELLPSDGELAKVVSRMIASV